MNPSMNAAFYPTNWVLRRVFRSVCHIQSPDFKQFPTKGPMILVGNHINFLEAPVLLPHLNNPVFTGIAKRETWNNPLFNFLFTLWGFIPIERGLVDREAFRQSLEALEQGKVLIMAPEGTRSRNGKLLQGKPGVAALAMKSGAPLTPVGCFGHEDFWGHLKRFQRAPFHVVVGKPFKLALPPDVPERDLRQPVTDEIMLKIAELLPPAYRGYYAFKEPPVYRYVVDVGE